MFVAPSEDKRGTIPRLFRDARERLPPEAAVALFLTNYEDLLAMVCREGRSSIELFEPIDLLAGQPEEIQAMASDSPFTWRLLLEKDGPETIGLTALSQCGPLAADTLFAGSGYGLAPGGEGVSEELLEKLRVEKRSALLVMKHAGWPGFCRLLAELQGWEPWHALLRRKDLQEPKEDPLIGRIARKLVEASDVQAEINRFNKMLRPQIEREQYPPTATEEALTWVPGYMAVKAAHDMSRGDHLERLEVAVAVVDGVFTATMVAGLAVTAVKTTARKGGEPLARKTVQQLEEKAAGGLTAQGVRQLSREAFARLPGAMFSLAKHLPERAAKMDITQAMRSASGVASKVGIRTWGKLDRRIIMRGDRHVLIDLMSPEFLGQLDTTARAELLWISIAAGVNELTPCIMERVIPALQTQGDVP